MPAPKGHAPYNKNGEGGRPEDWTEERINAEADAFEEWMSRPDSIWYKDFAIERNYHSSLFSRWAEKNERFRRIYIKSQEWQQAKLVKGGLTNKYNPGFTKFVMSNTCGWTDRQTVVQQPTQDPLKDVDGKSKELVSEPPASS